MKQIARRAARIISAAEIGDVRLKEAKVTRKIRDTSEAKGDALLTISHGARVSGRAKKDGVFYVIAGVEARFGPEDGESAPLLLVRVSYEVSYRLPDDFSATKAELDDFAQTNAVFNAWPYCREFIHSVTVRMGLPPIVLPLYRAKENATPKKRARSRKRSTSAAPSPSQSSA